jgi:decaprenylphospho-beta-D-ribofuranose 2-oxidase
VRREVVRPFNDLWYAKAPRHRAGEIQTLATFFHPLDALGSWNRLYGPSGFTQYQLVTPFSRPDVVARVIETLARARLVPSLVVLKTFGDGDGAPLSFPTAGWTLALDLPLGAPDLAPTLDGLDGLVAAAGGRVYLAKDGRLRPELVATMYPRLAEWEAARDEADPGHVFSSDLWRRLAPPSRG